MGLNPDPHNTLTNWQAAIAGTEGDAVQYPGDGIGPLERAVRAAQGTKDQPDAA